LNQNIIDSLKAFDWQKIIDYANSLDDLNDAQLRFVKGLAIELAIEQLSNTDLTYVGLPHQDYVWPSQGNISVELKSVVSHKMYDRKGQIKNTLPGIRLSNSIGTNKTKTLDPTKISDLLLVVLQNGAFAVPKQTVISKATHSGDGWYLEVNKTDLVELSGHVTKKEDYQTKLSESIKGAIKDSLSGI